MLYLTTQYLFLSFCIIPLEIIYSSIIDKLTVFFKQRIITINAIIFMYNPIRKSRLTENIKKYYNQKMNNVSIKGQ